MRLVDFEGTSYQFPADAGDDEVLAFLNGLKEKPSTLRRIVADPAISLLKSAIGVPEAAVGLIDIVTEGGSGKDLESAGFRPKEAKKALDELLTPEQKAINEELEKTKGFFATAAKMVENPSTIAHGILESGALMGAGGVVARGLLKAAPSLISKPLGGVIAGSVGEGVVGAGSAAEQIRQQTETGNINVKQALSAMASGVGTGLIGFGGGAFAKKLKLSDIDTMLATGKLDGPAGGSARGFIQRLLGGGISEGVFEELPQSAQEQLWQNYALNKPLMEGVPESGAKGMVIGAAQGAGINIFQGGSKGQINPNNVPPTPEPQPAAAPVAPPPPQFDQPTVSPTTADNEAIQALIASIDAELLDDKTIETAKQTVAKFKEERATPANPQAELAWRGLQQAPTTQVEDAGELGASPKSMANAKNYVNPNQGDRLDRTFLYGPEESIGKTPRQHPPQAGTYTLGVESEDRNADYLRSVHDTVEQWRQKYMPNSTFVISNEQLYTASALGTHTALGNSQHLIVPAVLRSPSKGLGQFNVNAQATAFYNLSHEFGHALTTDRFLEGLTSEVAGILLSQSKVGMVADDIISQLPASQQAVVREFNTIKANILDGSMNAQQFIDAWFGPAKLGRKTFLEKLGVAPAAPALDVGKALARKAAQKSGLQPVQQKVLERQLLADYFSLHEYLAEQTARHAYNAAWDRSTPLGQFFSKALESLRQFFIGLKKDRQIAPGTAFKDWIEGLPRATRLMNETELKIQATKSGKKKELSEEEKAARKIVRAAAAEQKKKAAQVPKVETVQHNVETDTSAEKAALGRKMVVNLIKSGYIDMSSPETKRLFDLLERNDFDAFRDEFQKIANKTVKFELDDIPDDKPKFRASVVRFKLDEIESISMRQTLDAMSVLRSGIPGEQAKDPEIIARAQAEWKEKQFRSSFFKAWFGDWENDAQVASKVTIGSLGQYQSNQDPQWTWETRNGASPLVIFHSSTFQHLAGKEQTLDFQRFSKGDLGFHFGTVRAAHVRAAVLADMGANKSIEMPELLEKFEKDYLRGQFSRAYIIPAVLNLRNPLYVGEERQSMWQGPVQTLIFLTQNGFITEDESTSTLIKVEFLERQLKQERVPDHWDALKSVKYEFFAPVRELLISKGWDGLIYENTGEGDTSFVAFHPNQVKSLLSSRTFSKSDNMHMELDFDNATPAGNAASKMYRGLKNFLNDPGPLRRALRHVQNLQYHVLGFYQLAHIHPELEDLQYMSQQSLDFNRYKSSLMAEPDKILHEWKRLGKDNARKLKTFLFSEADSDHHWFDFNAREGTFKPNAETLQKFQELGIDEELGALILQIKHVLDGRLVEKQSVILNTLAKRYLGAPPEIMRAAMVPVIAKVKEIRSKPYFPKGNFGNWVLTVEHKREGVGWEIVYREAFEDEVSWKKAVSTAKSREKTGVERVRGHTLTDTEAVLMALPLDFVDLAVSELGLNDEQVAQLMQILQPVKTDKAFKREDQARLGIKGYSQDAMRSFAEFSFHDANLLAKLRYRADFALAIQGIAAKRKAAEYSGDTEEVSKLTKIETYMKRTRDYVMSPPNELQAIRALVSISYLGLNVKTAMLNPFLLITTWSELTSIHGQVDGNLRFIKAVKQALISMKLTDLNERREGNFLPKHLQEGLDRALKDGVLSQSYAYHLAGMANAGTLERMYQRTPGGLGVQRVTQVSVDLVMWTFRLTELFSRRAAFLAQYQSALDRGLAVDAAYEEAVMKTAKQQLDYSLVNRPPFMRGEAFNLGPVAPLATIFMTFAQGMAFHAYGGYQLGEHRAAKLAEAKGEPPRAKLGTYTMKLWIVLLLAGGYEALPGAENFIDLLEVLWRKFGGQKKLRQQLRELVQSIDQNPVLWAHGFGHNIAGFDISRSVGLGRLVPGTNVLAQSKQDLDKTVGTLVLDMAGPAGAFIDFGLKSTFSDKPFSETAKRAPGGLGNIYTAYTWSKYGVRSATGAQIAFDLETGKLRDLTAVEIAGRGLGFNPTIVSESREIRWSQYDTQMYFQNRRKMLMDDIWRARWQKDKEGEADARKAVADFNARVPAEYKDLRLTNYDIARSIQAHQRQVAREEQRQPNKRRYRGLYEDVRKSFDEP